MWWEPRSEDEFRVRREVERLTSLVIERERPANLVYGVGSITWRGRLAPLLIVDRRLDPRREDLARVGGILFGALFSRVVYDLVGPLWPLSYGFGPGHQRSDSGVGTLDLVVRAATRALLPATPRPREWMFGVVEDAGGEFRSEFRTWSLPSDLIVLFSRPPKPLNSIGVAPLSKRRFGTTGLVGTVNSAAPGFTTAGHVVDGPGALVSRARRVLGLIVRIGERWNIVLHADPQGGPAGYDLAVASSENLGPALTFEARGDVVGNPGMVGQFAVCHLDGAVSGRRWGVVDATLKVCQADQRKWEHCWIVTGQSGWFCKQGDSGSLVELKTDAILGVLVGGLRIGGLLWGSRMEIGFAQDLRSTIEFVQQQHGCAIRVS